MVGQEDKRTNNRTMFPTLKNNVAASYHAPVEIELFKGAGLLWKSVCIGSYSLLYQYGAVYNSMMQMVVLIKLRVCGSNHECNI